LNEAGASQGWKAGKPLTSAWLWSADTVSQGRGQSNEIPKQSGAQSEIWPKSQKLREPMQRDTLLALYLFILHYMDMWVENPRMYNTLFPRCFSR